MITKLGIKYLKKFMEGLFLPERLNPPFIEGYRPLQELNEGRGNRPYPCPRSAYMGKCWPTLDDKGSNVLHVCRGLWTSQLTCTLFNDKITDKNHISKVV